VSCWAHKERPLIGCRSAAPFGVCDGLYTEFCPPASGFNSRRPLTDHSSGPVLANKLKRRPERRALRRRDRTGPPLCEGLSLLPFSGRGLPSPASRRGNGSSYLSFSPLPRAPCGAVRRCVFCGTFRRGKRQPPPSRWEAPCPAELGLSSAALVAAAIRRPPKKNYPKLLTETGIPRLIFVQRFVGEGVGSLIVGMAGTEDMNQLHFFKSRFQIFDSPQENFHSWIFGPIHPRDLIDDELGVGQNFDLPSAPRWRSSLSARISASYSATWFVLIPMALRSRPPPRPPDRTARRRKTPAPDCHGRRHHSRRSREDMKLDGRGGR
jgi:hypothetical protein